MIRADRVKDLADIEKNSQGVLVTNRQPNDPDRSPLVIPFYNVLKVRVPVYHVALQCRQHVVEGLGLRDDLRVLCLVQLKYDELDDALRPNFGHEVDGRN